MPGSREVGQGVGCYRHPTTLDTNTAIRLSRILLRERQSFSMVCDGKRWQIVAPIEDEQIILQGIADATDD